MINNLVSIILPCYNGEKHIYEALCSIKNQSFKNFEVIVIDDGSNDESLTIISSFFNINDKIINKIITRENKGFIFSLEEGISRARGNFIARIDADDIWLEDHLQKLVNVFNLNSRLVLAGTNANYINENGEITGSSSYFNMDTDKIIKNMMKDSIFIHSSVMFKKENYLHVKGYKNELKIGGEHIADYNLWFKLMTCGEFMILNDITLYYRILDQSMSRVLNRKINYQARLFVMKKVQEYYRKNFFYSLVFNTWVKLKITFS